MALGVSCTFFFENFLNKLHFKEFSGCSVDDFVELPLDELVVKVLSYIKNKVCNAIAELTKK